MKTFGINNQNNNNNNKKRKKENVNKCKFGKAISVQYKLCGFKYFLFTIPTAVLKIK